MGGLTGVQIPGKEHRIMDILSAGSIRYGEHTSYGGLILIPLFTTRPAPFDYALLTQAIASGTTVIEEVGGGTVPLLRVVNRGAVPVLLVDGEHLVGVKQNRVLNTTILVPEKSSLDIPVSCVEQGRWSPSRGGARPASPHLFAQARARKAESVTASVRSTGAYVADQRAVWQDVSTMLFDLGARSPSMAMGDLYTQKSEDIGEYIRRSPRQVDQTGVIAAVGGRVICCDLFDRPQTLEALWDRLIASYAVEAIVNRSDAGISADEGKAFLWEAAQATVTSHPAVGRGTDVRLTSDRIIGAALEVDDVVLHLAVFRRENPAASRSGFESPRRRREARPNTPIE
jgi:hypothetical protein